MKRGILSACTLLLAFFAHAQTKSFIDQPYLEVSGQADTLVTPNEIYLRVILSEKDTRDRVSLEEQEQKMITALKGIGLDTEKDVTTSDMTSNFKFHLLKSKEVLKTKQYTVKVVNAETASRVFIKLEELGISNTSIERVNHSELEQLENSMRTKAIIDAKTRAIALTKPLNQTVSSAIHIVDIDHAAQHLQGRVAGIQIRGANSMNYHFTELPKIEFEKIRVAATINVKFLLK